jgi:hypothetical protein
MTENKPPAPVKSRFQWACPGQSSKAGCSTATISGRLSQAATLRAAASWASKRRRIEDRLRSTM